MTIDRTARHGNQSTEFGEKYQNFESNIDKMPQKFFYSKDFPSISDEQAFTVPFLCCCYSEKDATHIFL